MENVRQVTLGSTFKSTWVSSGVQPSAISYNVLTGSETLASSYAGVDSGNGHFYADAVLDPSSWPAGLYQGVWFSTISTKSYRHSEWLAIFPQDTDQPGRYVTWDDVVNRFTMFSDIGGAMKAASHYLHYAEAELDSRLGANFTTPFSRNNVTARDLVIDMVYLRAVRYNIPTWKDLKSDIDERIGALNSGTAVMVTTSGEQLVAGDDIQSPAWSSTQDYHPVYAAPGTDDIDLVPSSLQAHDEAEARGW